MKIPKTSLVKSQDFNDCWYTLNKLILDEGITIGINEHSDVLTKDICCTVELTGNAINQIENKELHPDCKLKSGLDKYINQFMYGTKEYEQSTREQKYTYASRMSFDSSYISGTLPLYDRGIQLTTWNKYSDLLSNVRPCLQRVWVRNLGDNCYELHTTYRSHDCYGAWQFNNIALYAYVKRYIVPTGTIVKIVEYNDSLHVYDYDWEASKHIRKPNRNLRESYK